MAAYNRSRVFEQNYNNFPSYNRFESNMPPRRDFSQFSGNNSGQFFNYQQSSMTNMNRSFNRPQYPSMVNPVTYPLNFREENRMTRPYFDDKYMSGSTRMRFPSSPGERYFVPWNEKPQFLGSRMPFRNEPHSAVPPQPSTRNYPPRPKRKRKRKLNEKKVRKDGRMLKPWMTDKIYEEVLKKNELYIKAKNDEKNTALWQEFRLQRNRVSSLIKEAKLKGGFITRKFKEEVDDGIERPYACDTCDRAYVEESELEAHLKEHITCGINGCQFEAHPKVVDLHKKMQHDTGYADTILKLNDAEEIEKWRNERKSRFPTAENIQKRKTEDEEKQSRGELLETKDFGKFKKRRGREGNASSSYGYKSRGQRYGRSRGNRRGNGNIRARKLNVPVFSCSDSDDDSHIKISAFPGLVVTGLNRDESASFSSEMLDNSLNTTNQTFTDGNCGDNFCEPICGSDSATVNNLHDSSLCSRSEENTEMQINNSDNENCEKNKELNSLKNNCIDSTLPESGSQLSPTNKTVHGNKDTVSKPTSSAAQNLIYSVDQTVAEKIVSDITNKDIEDEDDDGPLEEPIRKIAENFAICSSNEDHMKPTSDKPLRKKSTESEKYNKFANRVEPHKLLTENIQIPVGLKKNNLLDKLLAKEIRQERNKILQCVHYIVKNNCFNVGTD